MSEPIQFQSFELTAADYSIPMFYAGCAICFRVKYPETGVPVLIKAMKQVTTHLPFLTGIVVASETKPGVLEVRPALSGPNVPDIPMCTILRMPHLRLATSEVSPDLHNWQYDRNEILTLAPLSVATSGSNHSVLRCQINVLADGIIFTLFANHSVIDGTGIGMLIELLAACSQSELEANPCVDFPDIVACQTTTRAILATIGSEERTIAEPVEKPHADLTGHDDVHDAFLVDYNLHLSTEKIQLCRKWIHLQGSTTSGASQPEILASDDDIVTAALWICLIRIRSRTVGDGNHMQVMHRLINARPRFDPPLPTQYLGNCFITLEEARSSAELSKWDAKNQPTEDSMARDIANAACILRAQLNRVDDQYVRKHLAQFARAGNWASTNVLDALVIVTSLRRLRAYPHFGSVLGGVVDFEMLPYMNPTGVCTIKPRRTTSESWEVGVTLSREEMGELRKDPMFHWLVERESPLRIFEPVQ